MLEEAGSVVALDGNKAWVQTIRKSACSSCEARNGCGQGVLASISDGKANQVLVDNTLNLQVGDDVLLGIPEDMLVRASFVVYFLPLLTMIFAAAAIEKWLLVGDGWVAAAGGVGLFVGFVIVRMYSRSHSNNQRFCPKMIRSIGFSKLYT
jgi:sigma-E factor negative regulatory protein RseC